MKGLSKNQSGQALLEFMLTLMIAVLVIAGIGTVFRKSLFNFWINISKEVTAPCNGCSPSPDIKN